MAQSSIGFGVLGLGMGQSHCRAVAAASGAHLVAVCDVDAERLGPVAETHNVRAYSCYEDMLLDAEIQAICIATPSGMHADHAMAAVASGRHVLVEKPVDIKVSKIRDLAAAAERRGVKASAVFQSRTDPLNRRIRSAIQDGLLGELIGVHAALPWYRKQSYYEGLHGKWKGTWEMDGGGSLMNQGIHTVDLVQWLAGPVERVFGKFGRFAHDIEAEDKTVAVLTFAGGALGTLHTTTAAYGGVFNRTLLIHGTKGTIHCCDGLRSWRMVDDKDGSEEKEMLGFYGPPDQRAPEETVATDPMRVGSTGHRAHIEDLVHCIRTGDTPEITIDSARHAVEIANAIYASGRSGTEVVVGTVDRR